MSTETAETANGHAGAADPEAARAAASEASEAAVNEDAGIPDSPSGKVVHVYDDIQECDNLLPRWWLFTFYATIVFAFGYWFYYHVFQTGTLPRAAYEQEMRARAAAESARIRAAGAMTPQALLALSRDPTLVQQGHEIFTARCASCHGPNAGGLVGPNLTDEFWIHGGAADEIYQTVTNGVPARAMPAWGPQIGVDQVQAVVAYVLTLRNSHVSGGRPPQGERVQTQ